MSAATARQQPGLGNKLLLGLLLAGLMLTWWKAPAFFRGTGQGVCGLELRYPPALTQVEVARADGRDSPRAAASGAQLAIPCGQTLDIRYSRAVPTHSAAPQRAPETRTLSPDELKPGVTLVELR